MKAKSDDSAVKASEKLDGSFTHDDIKDLWERLHKRTVTLLDKAKSTKEQEPLSRILSRIERNQRRLKDNAPPEELIVNIHIPGTGDCEQS